MITRDGLISILRSLPSFANLKEHELLKICNIGKVRSIKEGELLGQEGFTRNELQIILKGYAEVSIREILLNSIQFGPGNIFGEIAFFTGQPYSGTAKASTEVQILAIYHRDLNKLLENFPHMGMKIYGNFAREIFLKYRGLSQQLEDLAFGDPSAQVAHDIRSPVAALKVVAAEFSDSDPQRKELLDFVVERIDRIANTLLTSYKTSNQSLMRRASPNVVSLATLAQSLLKVINEKKAQYRSMQDRVRLNFISHLQPSNESVCAVEISLSDFERVISNLVDNSFQAIQSVGKIEIIFGQEADSIKVRIQDDGVGITSEVLSKLGKSKVSSGKKNGNGIGLYNAYRQIESWGGSIHIHSTTQTGTEITISLPVLE